MSTKKEEVSKAVAEGLRKFKEAVDKADQGEPGVCVVMDFHPTEGARLEQCRERHGR